jgi:RNA polymerase sigma factor (sigma-70 family)
MGHGQLSVGGAGSEVSVDARRALLGLDDAERAVIVLRFFADLSVDETAATLGIPNGTVKTRTRRAVERLRSSGLMIEVFSHE